MCLNRAVQLSQNKSPYNSIFMVSQKTNKQLNHYNFIVLSQIQSAMMQQNLEV